MLVELAHIWIKRKEYKSQEKNMEIIMRICEEAYLTRAAGLCREKYCIDLMSHSFNTNLLSNSQVPGTVLGVRVEYT